MSGQDDVTRSRKDFRAPYGGRNHVPTVQQYRQNQQDKQQQFSSGDSEDVNPNKRSQAWNSAYSWWYGADVTKDTDGNDASTDQVRQDDAEPSQPQLEKSEHDPSNAKTDSNKAAEADGVANDTSQVAAAATDPKAHLQQMKHGGRSRAERDVTDPVTHLPITIHDYTDKDLIALDEATNSPSGLKKLTMKLRGKTDTGLSEANREQQEGHHSMQSVFPPPDYELLKDDLDKIFLIAVFATVGGILSVGALAWLARLVSGRIIGVGSNKFVTFGIHWGLFTLLPLLSAAAIFAIVQQWARRRSKDLLEDDIWEANSQHLQKSYKETTESTQWLNQLLGSIWPLVNPDLFLSLADTLEDVMQASLPRFVRMVSVEDLGQGSSSMRILGIRWLPKAAASKSVTSDGTLEKVKDDKTGIPDNDDGSRKHEQQKKKAPSSSENCGNEDTKKDAAGRDEDDLDKATVPQDSNDGTEVDESAAEGMEAEEGDFLNLEIAFAYKPHEQRQTFRDRSKNAHMLIAFYLPGGIKIPVWVELRGLVGTMRMRSQLTPDPPFLALSTMTLLGQPKVDVSCIPLNKKGLNIMDIPLISNFVQAAVDAAMSLYVAPKSLTLDLKAMLAGDDFKKDTVARGILLIKIKRAFDFKAGDSSIPFVKDASTDGYVTVSWAKFSKPLFSTRVLVSEMEPWWMEEVQVLVGPEELDASESLRLQLWDSDRLTADDDLGRIEVPVKELMRNDQSNGKMWDRVDDFRALKAGEPMPGRCEWSVGYFSKTRLLDYQIKEQTLYPANTVEELKDVVYKRAERKLRQAVKDEKAEIEQLKEDDYQQAQTDIVSSTRPAEDYPSGILSIQVHQITGLGIEAQSRSRENDGGEQEGEEENSDELPSSYATIILNSKKQYKTRVKPKNPRPFFNAGCERFIRDWRTTEVYVSVRDARLHEMDPLLGIIYLPLAKLFRDQKTSHFHSFFPLTGGIGYGRVRISCVFRSVQLQAPKPALGWDYGTLRVEPRVVGASGLPRELQSCKLRFRTPLGYGKMHARNSNEENQEAQGAWASRHNRPVMLPVRKRYNVCMLIEFRDRSRGLLGGDKSPAFAVLWLHEIPDDEQQDISIPVFKGDMWRATTNTLPEAERGERVGELKLTLTFLRGLGHWHRPLAKKSPDMTDMFEVLDVATDCNLTDGIVGEGITEKKDTRRYHKKHGTGAPNEENESPSDTDSSDSEGEDDTENGVNSSTLLDDEAESSMATANTEDGREEKGGFGIMSEIKSYKHHKDQLHRRHRGVMQWKGVRTMNWMKSKTGSVSSRLSGVFDHKERQPDGIETEV